MYDLVLRGGRVIDPAQGIDGPRDLAFIGSDVAAVAPNIPVAQAKQVYDAQGLIVCPGLIDLHSHVYWGGTSLGVDIDPIARRSGTTTFVDAGSSGAGNFAGFRKHIVERATQRILAYLNISFPGIYAFSPTVMVGECEDLRLLDARECLRIARANADLVVGIKARVGFRAGGQSGLAPLVLAVEVAEELGLPVMAHIDLPPPSRQEVLDCMRPGDILTHCFRPFPNAPVTGSRQVRAEILEARERGILFDIGHGAGGFSFESATVMLAEGVQPDTISSDVHVLSADGPAYDILAVMSKFLALGMPLPDIIRAVTSKPAEALRRSDFGSLRPGSKGDATILELRAGSFNYADATGMHLEGKCCLFNAGTVVAGQLWHRDSELLRVMGRAPGMPLHR